MKKRRAAAPPRSFPLSSFPSSFFCTHLGPSPPWPLPASVSLRVLLRPPRTGDLFWFAGKRRTLGPATAADRSFGEGGLFGLGSLTLAGCCALPLRVNEGRASNRKRARAPRQAGLRGARQALSAERPSVSGAKRGSSPLERLWSFRPRQRNAADDLLYYAA